MIFFSCDVFSHWLDTPPDSNTNIPPLPLSLYSLLCCSESESGWLLRPDNLEKLLLSFFINLEKSHLLNGQVAQHGLQLIIFNCPALAQADPCCLE